MLSQNLTLKIIFDYPNFQNNLENKNIDMKNFIDFKESSDEKIKNKNEKFSTIETTTNITYIADKINLDGEFII